MGWTFYNSSGQQLKATADKAATQAEMEAATSTTAYATPARTQYHPGVAKAWARFGGTTTPTLASNYNCDSVTDAGVGSRTPVFGTDFSGTTYPVIVGMNQGGSNSYIFQALTHAAGSVAIKVYLHDSSNSGALNDDVILGFVAYGDQ